MKPPKFNRKVKADESRKNLEPEWATNPDHPDFPFGPASVSTVNDPTDPNLVPETRKPDGFFGKKSGKEPKLKKDAEQYKRSIKDLQKRWPGWYIKSEHYAPIYGGGTVKRDFGGFADVCGVHEGRFVAAQITTLSQVRAHIVKYTDPTKKSGGLGDVSIETNLRAFLANGGLFLILAYHKPGRLWEVEVTIVTAELLDECKVRKEKLATSKVRRRK